MSYNLLSGSVEFIGETLGTAEDLVNTHATQTITGAKTFTNLTASSEGDGTVGLTVTGDLNVSNDLSVAGNDLTLAEYIKHIGDTDTNIRFQDNRIDFTAGNNVLLMLDSAGGTIAINNTAGNRNFVLKSATSNQGMYHSAANRSFLFGDINVVPQDSEALVHITSSYHEHSLLTVGNKKNPIFAISGSTGDIGQGPRVIITGSLLVGGSDAGSVETRFAGGNVIAAGIVTGSYGLRGELLNVHSGLEHVTNGGEKKLAVKAHTGISVDNNGVAVDVNGLTDVGSINTSTTNQDFICVSDYSNSNATAKMGVGDLLAQTVGSVANVGSGTGQIYKTTLSREVKLKRIAQGSNITVTNGADDITIAATVPTVPITTYNFTNNERLITSVSNNTVKTEANLHWNSERLMVTGSVSATQELTGFQLQVGSEEAGDDCMAKIKTEDANKTLLLCKSSAHEVILGVTGSNKVVVGGAHFDGVFNVSGSNNVHLISLKSDSENPAFYVSGSGDAALSGRLALKSDGTADPTVLANHAHIYAKDVATSAEVFVRDEAGNITQISPHNEEGEWQYFSRNTRTGKVVRVNMERMI